MIKSIVITTDEHEIHLRNEESQNCELTVYQIEHSTKEIIEHRTLKTFDSANMYVQEKYLKNALNKGVFV